MSERMPTAVVTRLGLRSGDTMFRTMCSRVRLSSDVSEIKLIFSIPPHRLTPSFAASWGAAPIDPTLSTVLGTLN